ncbi:hypothetical protein [Alkaliphilus sp. B6464]|uniref:hypothetical protein n=1 Tax=Alkaliphilus sp. B6464 TaxID=2731219 RepID=UPI001BA95E15|nr:hypothetical protein [Alkaliphilus sp. B6464]QUH21762.1 hypothetical protein HYG84_17655 [Alkaliphilus sp. B6464]
MDYFYADVKIPARYFNGEVEKLLRNTVDEIEKHKDIVVGIIYKGRVVDIEKGLQELKVPYNMHCDVTDTPALNKYYRPENNFYKKVELYGTEEKSMIPVSVLRGIIQNNINHQDVICAIITKCNEEDPEKIIKKLEEYNK